jgi:hypothetical protein
MQSDLKDIVPPFRAEQGDVLPIPVQKRFATLCSRYARSLNVDIGPERAAKLKALVEAQIRLEQEAWRQMWNQAATDTSAVVDELRLSARALAFDLQVIGTEITGIIHDARVVERGSYDLEHLQAVVFVRRLLGLDAVDREPDQSRRYRERFIEVPAIETASQSLQPLKETANDDRSVRSLLQR